MSRYKVNRIGFVNFWLYDEEDFYFYDGKLLLRGTNGSGKTVTMQSFFPLIFDGNKSPERLDPFGSRDRKIEDYLLPEDFNGNENTGYLYMEFYDKDLDKYLTIGIGLRAIRNRNCEFWGFAITDNRRIGIDFLLFKERNLRIPLTKKELQMRIGTGGEFVETAKNYKLMVNKLLFGFENVALYSEFINLLIQVRSPKLSNSTRPSQLTKILSTVLEPLSEEDLRVMAESIDDMNKYKEKLADLQAENTACTNLKKSYLEYNKSVLYNKGQDFLKYRQEQNSLQKQVKEKKSELDELLKVAKECSNNVTKLELERQELEHRKSKLDETDLKNISNQLEEIVSLIRDLDHDKSLKEKDKEQKNEILLEDEKNLEQKQNELSKLQKSFDDLIADLTSYEDEIEFDDAKFYLDDLKKEKLSFLQFPSYLNTMKTRVQLLKKLTDIAYKIYQKEEEIGLEKDEYAKFDDKLKEIEKKRTSISRKLLECANEFKTSIAETSDSNKMLKLDQTNLNKIYGIIDNLEKDMFLKIKDILKNQINDNKDRIKLDISNNNIKINEYNAKIDKLKIDLQNAHNILIEPLDDDDTKEYFKENKIPFEYFFNTIKFKDNVIDIVRKQVESFLLQTGILTSFVTNTNRLKTNIKTKCLKEGKFVKDNLSTYLEPLETPFKDKVSKILKSISINDDGTIKILSNGQYELAVIEGTVDEDHELRYIGSLVRENYIKKTKEKIDVAINQLSKETANLHTINLKLDEDIKLIDEEFLNFHFKDEIINHFKALDELDLELKYVNNNMSNLLDKIRNKTSELSTIKEEFDANKKSYYGPNKYIDIKNILENTSRYLELLNQLFICFNDMQKEKEFVNHYMVTIQNIKDDLDNINIQISDDIFKLSSYNRKKQNLDDILNSDKYKDVGREYKKITERLSIINEEIPEKKTTIIKSETKIEYLNKELQNLDSELKHNGIIKDVAYKIFMDEYNLHYVDNKNLEENELYHFITSLKQSNTSRDIYEKFMESLNKYSQYLINYVPKNVNLHLVSDTDYLNFTSDKELKNEINNMLEGAIRRDIEFNYTGKNVNLLELSNSINTAITTHQDLISEENRRLFEDLLINNIGSSIRTKIQQSEEWIGEVKKLMESMQTSSGLSFSLKWNGITAETEDQVDTKEIVEIFKKEASMLKPEHLNKITNHFKSKIKMKEEALEESERNYLEIIKEVLDYRKWFEFKLYFKRGDGDKKELTDREFNKMSGGEKAIAMYVPLFASIYAKLNSAYEVAPHVIALDEAFAGVDDDNIKDAFRILDELNIDYVLTSQQLWGDYETIKHLAISELHHPINSKVVSIVKYKWDGKARVKIDDITEYQN